MDNAQYMKQAIIETVAEIDDAAMLRKLYALVMIAVNPIEQELTDNAV